MADETTLNLILDELKACRRQIDFMVNEVAMLKAADRELTNFVRKFWAENWGPIKADIACMKNRLDKLENSDFSELDDKVSQLHTSVAIADQAQLKQRVEVLEKDYYKRQGILAAASAIGGGGVAMLLRWLLEQ